MDNDTLIYSDGNSSGGDFDTPSTPAAKSPSYLNAFSAGLDELVTDPGSFVSDLFGSNKASVSTTPPPAVAERFVPAPVLNAANSVGGGTLKALPSATTVKWTIAAMLMIAGIGVTAWLIHETRKAV